MSLAAGVMPGAGPVETSEAAVAAGFDMAGVWVDLQSWSTATTAAVQQALAGLPVLDVEYIRLAPGPLDDKARRLIGIGGELGAANVLIVSHDPDDDATAAKLAELAAEADAHGMRAALEFGVFTSVKSLKQALRIVEAAAHPAAVLLPDPIHVDRSGARMSDLKAVPAERLSYAQFCDAPAKRPQPADLPGVLRDALDLRELPGAGALPLQEFLAALPAGLPISVEIRSEALRRRYPGAVERAQAVADAARAWLARNDPSVHRSAGTT